MTRAAIVGSSHGGGISIKFALEHPEMTQEPVLVGAVVGGMPYQDIFSTGATFWANRWKRETCREQLPQPKTTNT